MSRTFRRFEILLPLRFNDGQKRPRRTDRRRTDRTPAKFGAVSNETQTIRGIWQHQGEVFRDDLVRIFVDVPDNTDAIPFFLDFKERTKARFQQIDIWMTTYPIEVL